MSTTIEVETAGLPPRVVIDGREELIAWTDLDSGSVDVACGTWHLWLEGMSTRTTEVIVDEKSSTVRMMSGACPLDLSLGLRIVDRLVNWSGARRVETEEFGVIAAGDIARYYSGDWIRSQLDSFLRTVTTGMLSVPITIPGPFRDVIIGKRVVGALAALDSDKKRLDHLFEIMRMVHHSPGVTDKILTITSPGLATDETHELVFWRSNRSGLLPKSDLVGLSQNGSGSNGVVVTRAAFLTLDLPPWNFVDDANIQIEAASSTHLSRLISFVDSNGLSAFTSTPETEPPPSHRRGFARWLRRT